MAHVQECRTCRHWDRSKIKRVTADTVAQCVWPMPALPPVAESISIDVKPERFRYTSGDRGKECPVYERKRK